MDISVKRIMKDINDLNKNNLNSHGIYYNIYNDDIYKIKVLMIGPSNTPYEYGYYFFSLEMPNDYPFSPPKVLYCTQNGKTRFNPNLYTNGKVCLSIINTWSGPKWSSCNSISTVLLSIQALVFIENPLHNEPGYEKENGQKNLNYNVLLTYENFKTSILKMLQNTPNTFENFKSIINEHFINNYDKILENIENNMDKHDKLYYLNIYNMKQKLDYVELKKNIILLYKNIIKSY